MKNIFANIKKRFNNYLERMAEENKKNFGNQRLDCCSINKTSRQQPSRTPVAYHGKSVREQKA